LTLLKKKKKGFIFNFLSLTFKVLILRNVSVFGENRFVLFCFFLLSGGSLLLLLFNGMNKKHEQGMELVIIRKLLPLTFFCFVKGKDEENYKNKTLF
jgi:hypothetical protein